MYGADADMSAAANYLPLACPMIDMNLLAKSNENRSNRSGP